MNDNYIKISHMLDGLDYVQAQELMERLQDLSGSKREAYLDEKAAEYGMLAELLDGPDFVRLCTAFGDLFSRLGSTVDFSDLEGLPAKRESLVLQRRQLEAEAHAELPQDLSEGDYVTFGKYPQTAIGNDETPIEWRVLRVEQGWALLISRYVLDCKRYDDARSVDSWEESLLNQWLNDDFMHTAFSGAEQELIAPVAITLDNYCRYGERLPLDSLKQKPLVRMHRVFLLDINEAELYFASSTDRKCRATPYAVSRKVHITEAGFSGWWLRGAGGLRAPDVYGNGQVDTYGFDLYRDKVGVRPAMWIKL